MWNLWKVSCRLAIAKSARWTLVVVTLNSRWNRNIGAATELDIPKKHPEWSAIVWLVMAGTDATSSDKIV